MDALTLLLERQSCHALQAPGPDEAALDVIFRAALRVPDFLRLRPYRFIVAQGEGLDRLGAMMEAAAIASGRPVADIERAPKMPRRAPLVIVVVAKARESDIVTLFEQQLSGNRRAGLERLAGGRAAGFHPPAVKAKRKTSCGSTNWPNRMAPTGRRCGRPI